MDMPKARQEKAKLAFVAATLFTLPIVMGTLASTASAIFILLFLLALLQPRVNWQPTEKSEWLLIFLTVGFVLVVLISFINADDIRMYARRFERVIRIVGFVPVYFLLKNIQVSLTRYFYFGIIIAGPVLLSTAVFASNDFGRAEGAYNSILFGDYSSLIAIISLALIFFGQHPKWFRALALISFLCAGQAAILSGTRGAYIAIPIAFLLMAILFMIVHARSKRQLFLRLGGLLVLGAIVGVLSINNTMLKPRILEATNELTRYASGENTQGSIGLRIQMWEASVRMWQEHPIIGSGLGDFSKDFQHQIETGQSKAEHHFGEAHSLYFEFLGTTGSLGFATLMFAMFLTPAYMLITSVRTAKPEHVLTFASGISFILAFAIFAITQNWFGRSSITSVYFIGLALFLSESYKLSKAEPNDEA